MTAATATATISFTANPVSGFKGAKSPGNSPPFQHIEHAMPEYKQYHPNLSIRHDHISQTSPPLSSSGLLSLSPSPPRSLPIPPEKVHPGSILQESLGPGWEGCGLRELASAFGAGGGSATNLVISHRQLIDWDLNLFRSFLFVCDMRPEWQGKLPQLIRDPSFIPASSHKNPPLRLQHLPLSASDQQVVDILVKSDIYKEQGLGFDFCQQTAAYTIKTARQRANGIPGQLTRSEWRNVIENYLLNLACEAQCRIDYRILALQYKQTKILQMSAAALSDNGSIISDDDDEQDQRHRSPSPCLSPSGSLMKQSLFWRSLKGQTQFQNRKSTDSVILTPQEERQLWNYTQSQLYQRLGLLWEPDDDTYMST